MSGKKKIVFFTKSFNRTGSEILLLQLINGIDPSYQVSFFSLYRGELFDELNETVKKSFLLENNESRTFFQKVRSKLAFRFLLPFKLFFLRKRIWYVNTIVLPGILRFAKKYDVKCILHGHELEPMFSILNEEQKKLTFHYPSLVIANSVATMEVFKRNGRKKQMAISYPFIDPELYLPDRSKYLSLRNSLFIKENEFTWLMCGTLDKNKNPELFIELAKRFSETDKTVKFIWLGGNRDHPALEQEYVKKSSALPNIQWITKPGSLFKDYINACDGFVLTSHFESFSMVTLEALAAGKPVVANDCIGVNEILQGDIGKVIRPKNNADLFVKEMLKVMSERDRFDPEPAMKRALTFSKAKAIKEWNEILNGHLS